MNRVLTILSLSLMAFHTNSFGQAEIVKIGEKSIGESDIVALRASARDDPMQSVEKIRRGMAIAAMAGMQNADAKVAEKQLYSVIFGADVNDDRTKASLFDLPMETRLAAGARIDVFEELVTVYSEEEVPVVFTDAGAFWKLVQQTDLYRVRKEAGQEPKIGNWQYTRAELALEENAVVAVKRGVPFVSGAEYNVFVKVNFDGLRHFCTRATPVRSVQSQIAREVVRGKAILSLLATKEIGVTVQEGEAALSRYIRRAALIDRPDLKGLPNKTQSELHDQLYSRWESRNADRKVKLLSMLQAPATSIRSRDDLLPVDAGGNALYRQTMEAIGDVEVYDWMKAERFAGSPSEAKHVMTQERMFEILDKKLADAGVEIVLK